MALYRTEPDIRTSNVGVKQAEPDVMLNIELNFFLIFESLDIHVHFHVLVCVLSMYISMFNVHVHFHVHATKT
jgi:hypothetical protein